VQDQDICFHPLCFGNLFKKIALIVAGKNSRFKFSFYLSPCPSCWSSQKLLRSAIFLFLILVLTPSSSPNRYALYFLSLSFSLSLSQITPITAHSSSPAPLSLSPSPHLTAANTHTFRAAFQERHLFVSVCAELRLQEASVYKTQSYLLYRVCTCVCVCVCEGEHRT